MSKLKQSQFSDISIETRKVSTETVDITFDGMIVKIVVKEDADFTYEKSLNDRIALRELVGDRKLPVLIDASANFFVSSEGMDLAASEAGNANRKVVAYFTTSIASKLKLNVFTGSKKPEIPMRVFNTEQEALAWLLAIDKVLP